jgi:hypothetical protein
VSFDRRKARTAGKPGERKHRGFNGPWAGREIEMLESPAFRALSLSGHRMLARIEIELARHAGRDNGKLPVTYDDFIRYGIGDRRTVAATEREIEALGFARIIRGRAGNREYLWPICMGGYRASTRPYRRLLGDGKLIECSLPFPDWAGLGTKYSCFESVERLP